MRARCVLAGVTGLLLALGVWSAAASVAAGDRLDRFRELASTRLALAQLGSADAVEAGAAEIYALVDDEIVENLDSGGPFASLEFIQERLDAFSAAWGGASFRMLRAPSAGGRAPLTIGVFALANVTGSGSVRLYGRSGGAMGLVRTTTYDGVPDVFDWPPTRNGAAQLVASWLGPAAARGSRPLRVELWRQRGDDDVSRVWSSVDALPDGLWVSDFAVRRGEILLRYELRYPGWKPGCEGQTEHEDLYRYAPATETLALARRQVVNAWHRELQSAVARFFAALARGDRRGLAELVPDSRLRSRLPPSLRPEPACEAQNADTPGTVVVAATDERPSPEGASPAASPPAGTSQSTWGGAPAAPRGGSGSITGSLASPPAAARQAIPPAGLPGAESVARSRKMPWSLWWSRAPDGWRLAGAAPVLE